MNNILGKILNITCIVFVVLLCWKLIDTNKNLDVKTQTITDTLYVYKVDTIVEKIVKYQYIKTTDTIYLPTDNKSVLALPITQKYYNKSGVYDLWISGYNAKLDSIITYKTTQINTITNTTTNNIHSYKWDLYVFGGLNRFKTTFMPIVGISIKTPKKWLISPQIGLDLNNDFYWGVSIGYKVSKQ